MHQQSSMSSIEASSAEYIPQIPGNLPTHLKEIALILGVADSPIAKILQTFYSNSWQTSVLELQKAVEGNGFINIILDEINALAFDQIGQALLFEEGGTWVVEEDYRDEISYLLDHPHLTEEKEAPSDYGELTEEWAKFVKELQTHHWEALAALISKTDVAVRIDAIARGVYSTNHQIIDDINGFALDSIGDIIVDTSGQSPEIEEEDLEMVTSLLNWANQKALLS